MILLLHKLSSTHYISGNMLYIFHKQPINYLVINQTSGPIIIIHTFVQLLSIQTQTNILSSIMMSSTLILELGTCNWTFNQEVTLRFSDSVDLASVPPG